MSNAYLVKCTVTYNYGTGVKVEEKIIAACTESISEVEKAIRMFCQRTPGYDLRKIHSIEHVADKAVDSEGREVY